MRFFLQPALHYGAAGLCCSHYCITLVRLESLHEWHRRIYSWCCARLTCAAAPMLLQQQRRAASVRWMVSRAVPLWGCCALRKQTTRRGPRRTSFQFCISGSSLAFFEHQHRVASVVMRKPFVSIFLKHKSSLEIENWKDPKKKRSLFTITITRFL